MSHTDISHSPPPSGNDAVPTNSLDGKSAPARSRRAWLGIGAVSAAALEACGGGGSDGLDGGASVADAHSLLGSTADTISPAGQAAIAATSVGGGAAGPLGMARTYAMPATDADAARFLLHAQFSALDSEIAAVRSLGYAGWIAQQFNTSAVNTAFSWMNQHGYATIDSRNFHFEGYASDIAVWWQLFNAPDALRKRVALALSEIFVVSVRPLTGYWTSFRIANWWDMLSANSFGNFRTLLERVSLHPAMGSFLNILGSQKEDASGRQPDENFPREVMQLMTIGLEMLNPDGTRVMSGGNPVPTFNQSDVTNLARVFTGYNYNMAGSVYTANKGLNVPSTTFTRLPMVVYSGAHSYREVNFLGTNIPEGTDPAVALGKALDTLFNHPNVGPFIGRQLIQRLVTSNPSPSYVARVTAAFNNNGKGVRGDLGAVVAAILLDEEARGPQGLTNPSFGHLREPMVRFIQWGRTFGLQSASGSWKIFSQINTLGQSPMAASSVFNFFPPTFSTPGTAIADAGLVAPEFGLVDESTVASYLNYMVTVVRYGLYIGGTDVPQVTSSGPSGFDITATYTAEIAIAHDARALVNRLNLVMAAGQLSPETVSVIVNALAVPSVVPASGLVSKLGRIAAAVMLVLSSPEYLVQK